MTTFHGPSVPRKWLNLAVSASVAGCIGGALLLIVTLNGALPDCTAHIHQQKWSIFIDGAMTAAVFGLLPAIGARGRARLCALLIACCAFYGYLVGYWSGVAGDDDPFGPFGYILRGAVDGLFGTVAGVGIVAVCQLGSWLQRRLRRQDPFGIPSTREGGLSARGAQRVSRAVWGLALLLAGGLLSRSGLLPVRLTHGGYWLARNHGQGADLSGGRLASGALTGADLYDADLHNADLRLARLDCASLWCTNLITADLRGADLHGGRLVSADLRGARLNGSDLSVTALVGADLRGADLAGANLAGAVYDRRTHWPARFEPQQHGAVLLRPGARVHGANLRNADLNHEDLRGADLSGANLTGAQLNSADLRGANLHGAIFADEQSAWYEHVDFTGADLRGADLSGTVINGETVDLTGAHYDSSTRWPGGRARR